jgi:hypothetical protein
MTKWSWSNVKIIITTGVYLTRGLSGPNPRSNGPRGRPAGPIPWLVGWVLGQFSPRLHGHVSTREEEGQGCGERQWKSFHPAGHMARLGGSHLVSYCLGQVGGAPPRFYKYPPLVKIRRHTPLHGNSSCKALILSLVARRSLVGRVVRLWGLEGLPACQEPSS